MKLVALIVVLTLILTPTSSAQNGKLKVLHNFGSSHDGSEPNGPLLLDSSGKLYGVTFGGLGPYSDGIVFRLAPQTNGAWHETILHALSGGSDGAIPSGGLIFDAKGDLYGTLSGSPNSAGGVFALSLGSAGWSYSVIYSEGIALGSGPGLMFDKLGNLYGPICGGNASEGAIGELAPGSGGWNYTQFYSFCPQQNGCPDGFYPMAPPIFDVKGNLWGTMFEGGIGRPACANNATGCGVIYKMTPNGDGTWTYHVEHRFASYPDDGEFPQAGLTLDTADNFYGTTEGGGAHGNGTIFKLSVVGGKRKIAQLYDFPNCTQGCYPQGTLARDQQGNLYGMAQGGTNSCGGPSCGVVFRLAPQKSGEWKYSVLYNLNETSGGVLPFYGVILDSKGNLFGVTSSSGKYGGGTAFEISP